MNSRSKKFQRCQSDLEDLIKTEFYRLYGQIGELRESSKILLNIAVNNIDDLEITMDPSLKDQIRNNLRNMNVKVGAYDSGRVYCYLDQSSECSHCRPDDRSMVMVGYRSNGIPEWEEFLDLLIDVSPSTAAELYENKQLIAAIYLRGRDVKKKMTSGFGKSSRTYNILGQILCGYFSIRPSAVSYEKTDHIALTVQAVEHSSIQGEISLDINVISGLNVSNIMDYFAEGSNRLISEAVFKASKQLKTIEQEINIAAPHSQGTIRKKLMPKIPVILNEIKLEILKMNQRKYRRTSHAIDRAKDNRPISTAIDDLSKVNTESILEDPENKTMLIPGKNNRWHVFSHDGRLVTSLFLEKEQVLKRLRRKRWQHPETDKISIFIERIHKLYPKC